MLFQIYFNVYMNSYLCIRLYTNNAKLSILNGIQINSSLVDIFKLITFTKLPIQMNVDSTKCPYMV